MTATESLSIPRKALLSLEQTAAVAGVSGATVRRWSIAGTFPSPVKIGCKLHWHRDAVNAWLAEKGLEPLPSPESLAE